MPGWHCECERSPSCPYLQHLKGAPGLLAGLAATCLLMCAFMQVFPATTNPAVVTGDGQAMAVRAQANLAGMEFVQFHPTGFAGPNSLAGQQTFLISEAVRGEGGHLLNLHGHR